MIDKIREADRAYNWSPATFGLDQRVQVLLDERYTSTYRKSFYRVLQEPALISLWNTVVDPKFSADKISELCTLLLAAPARKRTGRSFGEDSAGDRFWFAYPVRTDWGRQLSNIADGEYSILEEIARIYTAFVFTHPFSDGNGRVSRALIYGCLARHDVIRSPCLGLNAAFDIHRDQIGPAFRGAARSGDHAPLAEVFSSVLEEAALLAIDAQNRSHQ